MDGQPERGEIAPSRLARRALVALATTGVLLVTPGAASADEQVLTYEIPISVSGYEVKQAVKFNAPRPAASEGHVTHMEVDLVDDNGDPVPIQRLMLHHIVFLNAGRQDQSCNIGDGILGFDNMTSAPAVERFAAAGEERMKMSLPPGYGYDLSEEYPGADPWAVLYMVMNHQAEFDNANIQYKVTVDDDPAIQDVVPFWMDIDNCKADPIYNIPGTGTGHEKNVHSRDFTIDQPKLGAAGGRIVAGGGHVHGGAYRLGLTQPACEDRELFRSIPTWGKRSHPFYNVRPILHEPGPINMSAFKSAQGFPVRAGESLHLDSVYDDTQPHTRVMGIMILYIAPDPSVATSCGALPSDVETLGSAEPGRSDPVPFEVPLTGLDDDGQAVEISKPPGPLKDVKSGSTLKVKDNFFTRKNVRIERGDELTWAFDTDDLHNLTLANGPEAIGSDNLSRDGSGTPRTFTKRFRRPGTYRMFCALHPVQMSERVVVRR